jgi:hypothetical protein
VLLDSRINKEETAAKQARAPQHPRSSAPVTKPARKLDKSQNQLEESSSDSSHYAVSAGAAINNKFQLVYDVIQLDRGKITDNQQRLSTSTTVGASAINSNVILAAAPCDKHPPEYFAQLLQDKQNQKAKLNQLWPKHWGCKTDLIIPFFFSFFPIHIFLLMLSLLYSVWDWD